MLPSLLGRNITYLFIVQIGNYLLPLITIPYITRVLGVSNYGWVEFAQTTALYFTALVDYSFHLTATRKLARIRDNKERTIVYFNTIFFSKLLLFSVAAIVFFIMMLSVGKFQEYPLLMTVAFLTNLGTILFPIWFFQGIEKLSVVAWANFGIKLVFTLFIFLVLKSPDDLVWVPMSTLIGQLAIGSLTLFLAFRYFPGLRLFFPGMRRVKMALKEGVFIFGSSIFNKIYSFSNVILLGFLVNEYSLGLYTAANKLIIVAQTILFAPLYGALFPHISATATKGAEFLHRQIVKTTKIIASANLVVTGLFWLFCPLIVQILFGEKYTGTIPLLKIMIPLIYASGLINIFLYQGLLNLNRDKVFFRVTLFFGILSLSINYIFISMEGVTGAAISRLISEILMAAGAIFYYRIAIKRQLSHA